MRDAQASAQRIGTQAGVQAVRTIADRQQAGRELRKQVPRSLQASWTPPANRADPVQILIENGCDRIAALLPIRYDRMRRSAFTFLRGSAAIMAADLASGPVSGLIVQACGDCHMANFGAYASPEGTPVFDVNDFDETLPAPFEWDLKRLATSVAVDASSRGLPDKTGRYLARSCVYGYRTYMAALLRLDPLAAWRSSVDAAQALSGIEDSKLREREARRLRIATDASRQGYPKLLERQKGQWRIKSKPSLIYPLTGKKDGTHEVAARAAFHSYRATLPEERRVLLDRYRLTDIAFKVVGIGSVGTFCAIGLFTSGDGDPLLLQLKEASHSALAQYVGPSAYTNQGQRVVVGQRMIQATADIFLGWTNDPGDDRHCYVRQLKDPRLATLASAMAEGALAYYAMLCGQVLARAHARSGDSAMIQGYMGSGGAFDAAIAEFAMQYAEQTDRDWRLFLEAIKSGEIEAHSP